MICNVYRNLFGKADFIESTTVPAPDEPVPCERTQSSIKLFCRAAEFTQNFTRPSQDTGALRSIRRRMSNGFFVQPIEGEERVEILDRNLRAIGIANRNNVLSSLNMRRNVG